MAVVKVRNFCFLFILAFCACDASPFNYDLHHCVIEGTNSHTMVCFHGLGGDYRIAHHLKEQAVVEDRLVSFNFPDHGVCRGERDPEITSFGTAQEILPAIYVLKQCIVDGGLDEINLYGFSAGGGAIINTVAFLNTSTHDEELKSIGVTQADKQKMLCAIQNGWIILDAPLKSVREVMAWQPSAELEIVEKRYRTNHMEPIDALQYLDNLSLNILIHFQNPDEVLSNRDDHLFIERLTHYNAKGTTAIIFGRDRGHSLPHPKLWQHYSPKKRACLSCT